MSRKSDVYPTFYERFVIKNFDPFMSEAPEVVQRYIPIFTPDLVLEHFGYSESVRLCIPTPHQI